MKDPDDEPTDPEITFVKTLAANGTIKLAATDEVEALRDHVALVLDAVGYPGAIVTDESRIRHFASSMWDEQGLEDFRAVVSVRLGLRVELAERVVDVARRLAVN